MTNASATANALMPCEHVVADLGGLPKPRLATMHDVFAHAF